MAKQYPVLPTYDDLMNAWKRKNTTQQPRPTMLDAAMEETMRYAQQGSQQRQNVAKTLTGGMTQRKQGDIKTWDWDLGRRTILDNEIANKYFREQGLFNTEDYAFNNAYVHLVGDDYLKSMLPVLGERIAASKLADEEAKTIRQQTAETSSRWIDLMKANNETEMDRWHNMLMADYLLGDKKQLFDFEAIDNRYAEMSDEEYEQEYKRLSDQWNNLDWETLTGSKANQYESQTGTLEGYRSTVEKELLRGAELEAMQADIRSHADYGSLSQYKGMQADADAWIDNTIDQNDIAAFNDLYSFMNINATWEQKSNAREKLANVARYLDEGYDYLTPDELADYNALYNAGRLEDAEKYLELLRPELLYRRAMVMKSYTEAKATNPYLAVPSWLDARIQNVANVFYLPQQIYETATGRDNPYSSAFDAANKVAYTTGAQMGAIQNWEAPEVLKDVVNYAYQGVTGATDNTMRLVSAGFNPTASLIIAGLQSASGSLKESAERDDMSAAAKIVKAIGTAAIEVGTEKIGLDALFDTGKNGAMQYIKNVVLSELGEETLNYISGDALEAVVAFLFEHEADIKSGAEFWEGLTDTAITTILSSLLMGGGGAIAQDVNTRATGKQLLREGDIEGVLKIAESMPAESASAKEAAPIRELQKGGKKVSTRSLGKLVNAVAKDIGDQNAATVNRIYEEAIEDRLVELGEDAGSAKKLAPVIRRVSKGEQIPLRERAAIAWTDNASQVVKELATETREGEEARVGQSWKTQTQGKLTEAAVGTLGKAAQFREALTSKTSNVTAASKAAERAKALTKGNKGKNKLQAKELAFDDGTKGQGEFKKVIKDGDTLKVGISIDGSDQLKEVSVDSLTGAGDEGLATILEYAAHESRHAMSAEEINIMAGTYAQQGGDAQEFIQQFEDSYLAGYSGVEKTPTGGLMQIAYEHGRYEAVKDEKNRVARAKKARSNAAPTVGWLGDVASDADVKGSGDAKSLDEAAKGMTEGQQLVVEFAKNLSRNTGLNIVLFRSKAMDGGSISTQNGSYDASTNTIYLDVHAGVNNAAELARQKEEGTLGYAIMRTMGHEVTHAIEATSVDFYDQYKQAVKDELTAGGKDWAQLVRRKLDNAMRAGQKLTYAGAEAEVVADASEYMLQDSQFVNNMDAGLKNKVKRIMQDFIGKIRAAFKALTGGHEESMALRTMQNGVMQYSERLQKLWDAGFMEMATAKVEGIKDGVADTLYKTGEIYSYTTQNSLRVRDKETIAYLENQQHITTYRAMQVIDGKLYPPMAEFIGSKKDGNREDPGTIGSWEMAAEHPELIKWVDGKPKFELKKTNDDGSVSTVPAAYNPYMHSSNTVLNDQFSKAFQRENLVVVECVVPVSESEGSYRAQYAKNATGWHEWKSGVVAGDLAKQKEGFRRDVFLSRYIKPVRILPDAEVAEKIAGYLEGTDVTVPFQCAWPSLREELVQAGVNITEPRALGPSQMKIAMEAYEEWKNHSAEGGRPTQKQVRETAYDYSAPFAQQVDDWVDGKIPERDTLLLGRTPSVLREIGFSDLPMTIDQKHMRYMLGEPKNADHDLGIEIVKRLPELVSNPVAIIANPAPNKGTRAPGVMIIFAEKNENANGRRIVGAVSVLENGKINGITIDSTRLETAHSRGDVDKKIADAVQKERNGGYGVYYINKNALSLLEPSQSQVLGTLGHEGVIHSIREAPEFVNSKFMEQTDTVQFRKWFEGSKIVNEDGTAKVMYHGTPYGGFTVFKGWQYFTDNKEYADKYHNPSASSIRGRYNPATNPQTYEVYLSVKKPFDTRDPKIRKIWRDEFHGNYSGTPLSERGLPDWTDGIDLIDFIEENDYDYDAIILDEGGAGGYGDEVQDRGISVVVRNSTQVKSATGNVGTFDTQNPDIRYSRRDEEYMDAVNSGDTSKARQLVTEAAKEAGYKPLRLYHGTKSFGFTKFDVGKSDDKLSIFATDSLRIAESYSGENVNRNLKKASKEDRYEFLQRPSAELLPYVHEHIGEHLRLPTEREMRDYTDEASTTILKAFDAIQKYLDDHNDTLRIEAKQALTYMLTYAEKMAEFMTLDMEDEADGYMIRMKYEDAKLDLSFEDRDAYDALYDVAGRPVIEAANKLLQARFSDPFYNEKTKTFVSKWDVTDRLGDAIFSGIYDLYGIDGNLFEMDANDANWNTLDGSAIGREGVFVNTRAVAEYAKENGYDGVLIKNVRDGGGMTPYHGASNVFIYFNNTALKSADLVTYDDNGDVIPLPERFDKNQEDIRYSRRDEAPDGVSIREFLGSMKPTDRMTETEKLLLKRYQENLRTLEEKEKLVAEQEEIIRTAPIKSDELTMAKNRHQIYRTQANRAARALMDAERSEGFARVMATSQEVVNRYLLGSAGAVGDAADVLDEEIAGLTAQLKAVEADVTRTASGQRTAFARGLFDQKQLNEAAQKLKDTYGSRMSVKAIADRLALAYGEIYAENGAEGAKLFMAAARDLAEDMLRGNKYRYKSEILPLLAEQIGTISLTETDVQEIRNAGLTVSEYKRMLSPYIKVVQGGSGLSSYASNAAYYGEGALASVLGEDIEGNLAMHLYDVISREKDQEAEISYEGMSEGQLIAEAMADIAGANLPMSTDSKTVDYLRKELLKYAGESAQAAQKVEQAIMNAQAATRRASGVWRAAVQEVNTAKQAVEYYRKLEEQRRLTELKEQKQEITAQLRSDYAKKLEEKVQKQRTEYREREQKAREYRHSREELDKLRRRIGRNVKRLNTMRMRETDQRHVPQEFQHLANAVMQTFTDSSLSKLAFSAEKTASLARRYRLLQEVESDMTHYWDDEIEGEIENLVALSEAYTTIREREAGVPSYFSVEGVKLETEILTGVDNIVSNVLQMIDSANDAFLLNRNETFEAYATKTGEEIRKKQDYKQLKGWLGKAQKMLDENIRTGNMTPIYFMEHLQSPLLKEVFDEVRMGQSDYAKIVAQGKDFVQGAKEKYHYGAWVADGKLKMKTSQGHQIELTREEAAELYAIAKRESTNKLYQTEHLLYGGFQYKDITKKGEGLYAAKKESHQLDAADIAKISRWLTDEQKAYADTLVGFLSTTMADYGNAASMEMYGYKKFKEAYYIPFHTAAEQRFQRGDEGPQGENAGTGRLKNSGFTKKLQHGANATLVVGGLTDTVSEHIHKMATYAAMVQPIENMKRLLNHKVMEPDGTTNTIRALIGQKYGQASQDYMAQLLKDLNGAAMGDERATDLVNSWLNAFKRGAVMASASVVLQQPTAMARAMAYISPKYFAQNPIYRPSKGTWDEMMKYAGTAVIKDMGKFDVGMGLTARQYIADEHLNAMEAYSRLKADSKWEAGKEAYKRALDWLTAAPGKADQWTWGLIWKAVKAEQAELHPGMDVNSEEFLQLCGDRFDDVIDHTQVYDSVITRSNLMRSKNGFHRMATSFMSEPTLSINMLYDAFLGKHDKKQRAKILAGVIVSQVLAGTMAALAQAWNDDDDKRNWLERYADRATANILDNLNPLGMLPYVSDLMSLFAGYEVERPDMAAIADIIDYGKTFISKAADPDKALTWKDYENFVGTLANMAGLPAKNISREVRRTRNLIMNSQWNAPDAFSVGQAMLENVPFYQSKNAVYYERIVAAELNGDTQKAEDYREYMLLSKMVSEESLRKGLKAAMQERFISGGADEDAAKQYLLKIGAYAEEDDAYWEVDKWKDMRDEGIAAGDYRKYADFFQAVETGENLRATIKEYLDNGVSKTTLADQITTKYRKQLIDLKASGKGYADLQARLLTAYEALGYDRAQKQKDIQKWFEKK